MPGRVLGPAMGFEERVLLGRTGLRVSPAAAHPVVLGVDEFPSFRDAASIHQIPSHYDSVPGTAEVRTVASSRAVSVPAGDLGHSLVGTGGLLVSAGSVQMNELVPAVSEREVPLSTSEGAL